MDLNTLVSLITGGLGALGVMSIVFALLLIGKLHTDGEFQREVSRGDREKDRADVESQRNDELTKALVESDKRADTAVKVSQLVTDAFTKAAIRRSGRG